MRRITGQKHRSSTAEDGHYAAPATMHHIEELGLYVLSDILCKLLRVSIRDYDREPLCTYMQITLIILHNSAYRLLVSLPPVASTVSTTL